MFVRESRTGSRLFLVGSLVLAMAAAACGRSKYFCAMQSADGNTLANATYEESNLGNAIDQCVDDGRERFGSRFGDCICGDSGGGGSPTAP